MFYLYGIYCILLHLLEASGYPQDVRLVSSNWIKGHIKFSWHELDCDKHNGWLLGYECTTYFDNFCHTENVPAHVTSYTLSLYSFELITLPRAFSVAAINNAGVGDHCPPLNLTSMG